MTTAEFVASIDPEAGWYLKDDGCIRCPGRAVHCCCPVTQRYDAAPCLAASFAASLDMSDEQIEDIVEAADRGPELEARADLQALRLELLVACRLGIVTTTKVTE